MRPLWPPPTMTASQVLAASSLIGAGQADLAELLCDRVHGEISLATASTTTAPSLWTRTGLHSTSSRPGRWVEAGREAGGGGKVGLGEQGGALELHERLLHARGRGGQRDDDHVVEHLGERAAEADDERGHDGVAADGDDQLDAGSGHPFHEHGAGRAERAPGGADVGLRGEVEGERPGRGLVPDLGAAQLDRHGPAELGERGDGVVLAGDDAALDDRNLSGPKQVLGLMLGEPAAARRGSVGGGRSPVGAVRSRFARGGGHLAEAGGVGRRGLQRGRAGEPCAEAADGGDARLGEAPGGRVVEQLRQSGGDEDRDRARGGAVEDAVLDRLPALGGGALEARRVVVEDEHLVDVRVLADEADDVALPFAVAPDQRGVVERVGDRGRGREALGERGLGGRRERGELEAEPLRLVRAEPRVSPRAGEDPEPAAARPGAADGERLRELEQVVHVLRPRGAGLARERAEHPVVAGQRAGVGGSRGGADLRRPDLEDRDADARVGARRQRLAQLRAVAGVLDHQRDRPQLRLRREVGEPAGGGDDRLVAGRDRGVQPQAAAGAERVDDEVAALRDEPDVPRLHRRERVPPQRRARVERDQPVAVRAADGERVAQGRGAQVGLEGSAGRNPRSRRTPSGGRPSAAGRGHSFGEAGSEDDGSARAYSPGLVDDRRDLRRPAPRPRLRRAPRAGRTASGSTGRRGPTRAPGSPPRPRPGTPSGGG